MTTTTNQGLGSMLPRTGAAPGQPLWGEAPRRQPIAPLVLMAVVLLLVAAPTALGGAGGSSNPITLLKEIAGATYELTGLVTKSNDSLARIDKHSSNLVQIQENMVGIAGAATGMSQKTAQLNTSLQRVGGDVATSKTTLHAVSGRLTETSAGMHAISIGVGGSLESTKGVVGEFGTIDGSIGGMQQNLTTVIERMGLSAPLTKAFANNQTRMAIVGGNGKKFGVPNFAPDNRVMSVMLPMIKTLQEGGPLPARKVSHTASNVIVNTALKIQVPDGTNVVVNVRPYDGFYGLPPASFFIANQVHGL